MVHRFLAPTDTHVPGAERLLAMKPLYRSILSPASSRSTRHFSRAYGDGLACTASRELRPEESIAGRTTSIDHMRNADTLRTGSGQVRAFE